jgi:hypothetical protein
LKKIQTDVGNPQEVRFTRPARKSKERWVVLARGCGTELDGEPNVGYLPRNTTKGQKLKVEEPTIVLAESRIKYLCRKKSLPEKNMGFLTRNPHFSPSSRGKLV